MKINRDDYREVLAQYAHEAWVGWMRYLFDNSECKAFGAVQIPADLVERWERQMNTHYVHLSEKEKESDRAEADKMLDLMTDCMNACEWSEAYGWVPEAGCPVHDPGG